MTIVVDTLAAEYRRVSTKLNGANQRLSFANSQVVTETALIAELEADLGLLAAALHNAGGGLPADEPAQ